MLCLCFFCMGSKLMLSLLGRNSYPDTVSEGAADKSRGLAANSLLSTQLLVASAPDLPMGKDRFNLRAAMYSLKQKTVVATADQLCV